MTTPPIIAPKKLIEVALPLEAINKASAKEKSIKHGHPSTLHLWWARRPLAAARAMLFAQLVNDPAWRYPAEELTKPQVRAAITRKRNELFRLLGQLVEWENSANADVLLRARHAIRQSWVETCEANAGRPGFDPRALPLLHDPFAGGGSIPLEARRLGLDVLATDLNPIAVLINKATLELPSRFAGIAPVGPVPIAEKQVKAGRTEDWSGARGLAEDVRRYAVWMREHAKDRLERFFAPVMMSGPRIDGRKDLKRYAGMKLTIVAWIWARAVRSPNPAAKGSYVPLVTTWFLCKKEGAESWIEPTVDGATYRLQVRSRAAGHKPAKSTTDGTKTGRGANFRCLITDAVISGDYIKEEGSAGRLRNVMIAVVLDGAAGRVYVEPNDADRELAESVVPEDGPRESLNFDPRAIWCPQYGLKTYSDLFTRRQLHVMNTYAALVREAHERIRNDAAPLGADRARFREGGRGPVAYADVVTTYLALLVAAASDDLTSIVTWRTTHGTGATRTTFARQGLPMTWDFAEVNPFAGSAGDLLSAARSIAMVIERLPTEGGAVRQANAMDRSTESGSIISTDPPYFDNIGYADLSDFFYVWHRRMLRDVFPDVFATILVPKSDELVAAPYRHGGKAAAETFFLEGMTKALSSLAEETHPAFPITIYYAFKQSEDDRDGVASTGWDTFLSALLAAGFAVTGTWPVRTERAGKITSTTNILASSIVLSCRRRELRAGTVSRREFLRELDNALPRALAELTSDPLAAIAPVDLAQAAIGPGMAVFSQYSAVLEADGSAMTVRDALVHINRAIDVFFAETEGELDADTRFCLGWFQQYGFEAGAFGEADVLARAKGTAVDGVVEAGVLAASKNKVRLLRVKDYAAVWDPRADSRVPVWEACHQMCRALGESEHEAGVLLARMPEKQDAIRQLAYRLYTVCERKGWAEEARAYNELVTSWPAIVEESVKAGVKGSQLTLM